MNAIFLTINALSVYHFLQSDLPTRLAQARKQLTDLDWDVEQRIWSLGLLTPPLLEIVKDVPCHCIRTCHVARQTRGTVALQVAHRA